MAVIAASPKGRDPDAGRRGPDPDAAEAAECSCPVHTLPHRWSSRSSCSVDRNPDLWVSRRAHDGSVNYQELPYHEGPICLESPHSSCIEIR